MLKSLIKKINRLEQRTGSLGDVAVIYVEPGETEEEAAKKHFARKPKDERAGIWVFFRIPATDN